jgi:ABC-type multidrug transport system fused ATPase/permease subunit
MTQITTPGATMSPGRNQQRSPAEAKLGELATLFIDVIGPLAGAMGSYIHAHEPQLRDPDAALTKATRLSCESNLRELFSLVRADIPLQALDTPPQALHYARFLHGRGVGFDGLFGAYERGVALLRGVIALELSHRGDRGGADQVLKTLDALLDSYVQTVLGRLAKEFDADRSARRWVSGDASRVEPEAEAAAETFRSAQIAEGRWLAAAPALSGAHAWAQETLDLAVEWLLDAASDPDLSRRLALAETTVAFVLADEPDLGMTLRLDRTPIEVLPKLAGQPDVTLWISTFDLSLLVDGELKLSMAIARGRVRTSGSVRQFLRVVPVLTARTDGAGTSDHAVAVDHHQFLDEDEEVDETGFGASQRDVLDAAADYRYHSGALEVNEVHPGDFWSVECIDVFKAFGKNRVLNGLNLGIPEGMITVILGPSGTGKSVLINHLIGLMFPDHGDILVHGKSVPQRRRSELFEMRREFGILFQDGALFGSMNVYDNVAFPLREQTNKSEDEIRDADSE